MVSRAAAWRMTLVVVLLAIALKWGSEVGLAIQFVLGRVAYSTSNRAALYLLVATLLAVWRLQLAAPDGQRNSGHTPLQPAFGLIALWLSLLAGHILHLTLAWHYLADMQIEVGQHVYHWNTGGYSFTGLFHSHLGKTAAAVVVQTLHLPGGGYDTGQVFLPWVPAWAAWGMGAAFCVGLAGALMALPHVARAHSKTHVVLFGLASALLLRGMLDGGPLAPATVPNWIALVWVCLKPANVAMATLSAPVFARQRTGGAWPSGSRLAMLAAYVLLAVWFGYWLHASDFLPPLGGLLFSGSLMLWLGLSGPIGMGVKRVAFCAVRWVLVALMGTVMALEASDQLLPMVLPLPPGCHVMSLPLNGTPATEHDCSGKSAFSVYRAAGEDPRKPNHTLLWRGPAPGVNALQVRVLMVDAAQSSFRLTSDATWPRLQFQPVSRPGGWLTLDARTATHLPVVLSEGVGDAVTRNNYNVYLWALGRTLISGGLTEFILMPQTRHNRKDNLLTDESVH